MFRRSTLAPWLIATGIGWLIWASSLPRTSRPVVPSVTAVALIGCGVALHARDRWQTSDVGFALGLSQLVIYAGLTVLFAGARLHALHTEGHTLGVSGAIDISVATLLLGWAGLATFSDTGGQPT